MKDIPRLTFGQMAGKYCEKQESEPGELRDRLFEQKQNYQPTGWMLLEAALLDSSYCGQLTILPYGPRNTFKEIPDHPISPRGLASDMSVVVGYMLTEDL